MLWFSAVSLAILACWRLRKIHSLAMSAEVRKVAIRSSARLLLLASAGLALLLFILSNAPVIWPSIFSRYLVGLLIATPALLWPLWNVRGKITQSQHWLTLPKVYICRVILLILTLVFLVGTLKAFAETPTTQEADQQQSALIKDLMHLGVSHIYTNYWTCDRIAFLSQEHIICAVIDGHLRPVYNRYGPYYAIVIADPHAAYVFPFPSWEAHSVAQKMALSHKHYQELLFDGYVIFLQ
jgi:hypothetical protein